MILWRRLFWERRDVLGVGHDLKGENVLGVFWGVRIMVWPSVSFKAFSSEIEAIISPLRALRSSTSFLICSGDSFDRMCVFHCSISCS